MEGGVMLYFIIGLIIGGLIGYRFCAWVAGRKFQELHDQSQLVTRTPEGWQGTDEAIDSIVKTAKR
jgi:hypothetical protein